MFKKLMVLFYFLPIICCTGADATEQERTGWPSLPCSFQLKETVASIQKLPEANDLIAEIWKEGPISIVVSRNNKVCQQFDACWDPQRRIIFVDLNAHKSRGTLIGSILFELHNALITSQFDYYDKLAAKGAIKKKQYVSSVEYLEYENSLHASRMAEKGIELGIFPADARLPAYSSFEEYYYFQRIGGHSACIARTYEQMRSHVK